MVQVLLESSSKHGLKNKNGVSAGSLVRQLEQMRITKNLIEHRRQLTKEECEAAEVGDVEFLNERLVTLGKSFLVSQTPQGSNILHILFKSNFSQESIDEKAQEFIGQAIQRQPSLNSEQDCSGDTPIHIIVADTNNSSLELLELVSKYFETAREKVASDDYIGGLHSLPWGLKNEKGDTPLHVAVKSRNYKCAMKLLEVDEVVAGYVNNRKETPLHLLSSHDVWYSYDISAVDDLISKLIIGNADIPYMQDEDGNTPLLIAVREDRYTMIRKLHQQFPTSSDITDLKGNTLWHLFANRRPHRSLKSTTDDFEYAEETCKFLIHKDSDDRLKKLMVNQNNDGNTPLHFAIKNRQFGYAQFFIDNGSVGQRQVKRDTWREILEEENNDGESSFDLIASAQHLPTKFVKFLFKRGNLLFGYRSLYGVPATKTEEYANTLGVIAALLTTITFTAAFTVPGGLDSTNGTPLLLRQAAFQVFMVADVVGMCTSMMVLFCLLWIMSTGNKASSILLLDASIYLLQASFHATLVTFMMGLYVTTIPIVPPIAIVTCVVCALLIILMMHKKFFMWAIVPFCAVMIILGPFLRMVTFRRSSARSNQNTDVESKSSEESVSSSLDEK